MSSFHSPSYSRSQLYLREKSVNESYKFMFSSTAKINYLQKREKEKRYGFIAIFMEFQLMLHSPNVFPITTQSHLFHRTIICRCHRVSIIMKLWRRRLSRYRKK